MAYGLKAWVGVPCCRVEVRIKVGFGACAGIAIAALLLDDRSVTETAGLQVDECSGEAGCRPVEAAEKESKVKFGELSTAYGAENMLVVAGVCTNGEYEAERTWE